MARDSDSDWCRLSCVSSCSLIYGWVIPERLGGGKNGNNHDRISGSRARFRLTERTGLKVGISGMRIRAGPAYHVSRSILSLATMLKLTLILCVALYAGLVIYSDAPVVQDTRPSLDAVVLREPDMTDALMTTDDGITTITTADGLVLEIAAVISPGGGERQTERRTVETDRAVAVDEPISPEDATIEPVEEVVIAQALPLVAVNGSSVNLRSGPSTDTEILASLPRDTQAEILADVGDGWAQIRVTSTGVVGYMADRFLDPVN